MWEQVPFEVDDPEVALRTTGVYREAASGSLVGVLRFGLLSPPYLWFRPGVSTLASLRRIGEATDALQRMLGEPVVFADPDPAIPCAAKFLRFAGFTKHFAPCGTPYYERRL